MRALWGIDLGQTNLRIAQVNPETGEIMSKVYEKPVEEIQNEVELSQIISREIPSNVDVGVCAAGTIDEKNLIVKEAPNSNIKEINFGEMLCRGQRNATLTNDMKAAVSAEAMYGQGKDLENVLVATFSSGYNCAKAVNKKVVTTAEFGHVAYKPKGDLFCGCGGRGHIEYYVSGNGAAGMAVQYFHANFSPEHMIMQLALKSYNKKVAEFNKKTGSNLPTFQKEDLKTAFIYKMVLGSITAKHVYKTFEKQQFQRPQKQIREIQIDAIAYAIGNMNSSYNPLDIMIFMGSQTKDWRKLFQAAVIKYKEDDCDYQIGSLNKPKVVRTKLPQIGIQGGVAYHLQEAA